MENVFLTAEWRKLINITFAVAPEKLLPYMPKGLEPALVEGKAHVSLVAFDFLNTKVMGCKIPFHIHFPEINLRFYVRYKKELGVVFIREFVPKMAIAKVAQWQYNEPYQAIRMKSHTRTDDQGKLNTCHLFGRGNYANRIEVVAQNAPFVPSEDSLAHYFKEHTYGFGILRNGKTNVYRVQHPVWEAYPIEALSYEVDFEQLYGKDWAFLKDEQPLISLFAEGSVIKVMRPMTWEQFVNTCK